VGVELGVDERLRIVDLRSMSGMGDADPVRPRLPQHAPVAEQRARSCVRIRRSRRRSVREHDRGPIAEQVIADQRDGIAVRKERVGRAVAGTQAHGELAAAGGDGIAVAERPIDPNRRGESCRRGPGRRRRRESIGRDSMQSHEREVVGLLLSAGPGFISQQVRD
jgi:hypothetical protein